jgi:hypothetical protein
MNVWIKGFVIIGLLRGILTNFCNAQEAGIWVLPMENFILIQDFEKSLSSNLYIKQLVEDFDIYSISRPLPDSKNSILQNVLEFKCNCDESILLETVRKADSIFLKSEISPKYSFLYEPNDYNIYSQLNYALNLINAKQAWDITKGDTNLVVAVCDQNFSVGHEELIGKVSYYDTVNYNSNFTHGTAVAITLAGSTDNGVGLSSIGFNVKMQLRSATYNSILQASYSGAKVINISWSSGCFQNWFTQSVIDEVYQNGTVVVAAAGNGNTCGGPNNLVYPAAHDHVISVSSVGPFDNHERIYGNSSTTHQHNSTVDLCAPGYDVLLSPTAGLYLSGNGTSFAAPYVSGLISLMLSINPCLNPDEIEFILKETAVNLDSLNPNYAGVLGAGRIDAYEAVLMASQYSTIGFNLKQVFDCTDSLEKLIIVFDSLQSPISSCIWNNGHTENYLINPEFGTTYNVFLNDLNGCIGYEEIIADTLHNLNVNTNISHPSCFGNQDGTVTLDIEGGNGQYSIEWLNLSNSNLINLTNLNAGIYTAHITDQYNCEFFESISLMEPSELLLELNYLELEYLKYGKLIVETNKDSLDSLISSYSWNTGEIERVIDIDSCGFYEVEVVDNNGCIASANIWINPLNNINSEFNNNQGGTVGISEELPKFSSVLYPNPVSENGSFRISNSYSEIQFFNLSGSDVSKDFISKGNQIFELSHKITKGYYFVHIQYDEGWLIEEIVVY